MRVSWCSRRLVVVERRASGGSTGRQCRAGDASAGGRRRARHRRGGRTGRGTRRARSRNRRPSSSTSSAASTSSPFLVGHEVGEARRRAGSSRGELPDRDVLLARLGLQAADQAVVDGPVLVAEPLRAQRLQRGRQHVEVDRERQDDVLAEPRARPRRDLGGEDLLDRRVRRGRSAARTRPHHRSSAPGPSYIDRGGAEQRDVVVLGVQAPQQRQELVPVERHVSGSRHARPRGTATAPPRRGRTAG